MAIELYTINGNYPDRWFNFTLVPENMDMADIGHVHTMDGVSNIRTELDKLSDKVHKHDGAVSGIDVEGTVVINSVKLESGANNTSISVEGSTITMTHTPVKTDNITGVINAKQDNMHGHLHLSINDLIYTDDADHVAFLEGKLHHADDHHGSLINMVKIQEGGAETDIKKVFVWEDGMTTEVYPNAASHLRIMSNYDDTSNVKALRSGDPYGVPVINPLHSTYKDLEVTIIPYPVNSGWVIRSTESLSDLRYTAFDLGEHEGRVYYGPQVLKFTVPEPAIAGYYLHGITVFPLSGNNVEPETFSFYSVKYATSGLEPIMWYSFDDRDFADKGGGGEEGAADLVQVNNTKEPLFNADGVTGYALQAVYQPNQKNPNQFEADTSGIFNKIWSTHGLSLTMFAKLNRGGVAGFEQPDDTNATNGSHFCFEWSYKQPNNKLPLGAGQTKPATTAADRLTYGWCHLGLTMSPPINILNDDRFVKNFEKDEDDNWILTDGNFYYKSKSVDYETTLTNTRYVNYSTDFVIRIVKFYINGTQQGEMVVATKNADAGVLPGKGVFTIKLNNNVEQDGTQPDIVDEVKVFTAELSKSDVRAECALIGIQFDEEPEDGEEESGSFDDINSKPARDEREGRKRTAPTNISEVEIPARLKVFIIDNQTIAVGACFKDFFIERFREEFKNMDAVEHNYIYGYEQKWKRDFYYKYNLWDLYRDYQPIIVDEMDDENNWTVDNRHITMIGGWQNSTGLVRMPDSLHGTDVVTTDAADIVHFRYLKLAQPMTEGSSHTVKWKNGSATFTYSKDHYVSSIKVNQVGYSINAGRKYAYFGAWLGTAGAYEPTLNNLEFKIIDAVSHAVVYTGIMRLATTTDNHRYNGVTYVLNGEKTYVLDFSDFNTPGDYKIFIEGIGCSHKFNIGLRSMGDAWFTHCRGLFHHRAGCDKVGPPYTNWLYGEYVGQGENRRAVPKASHYWTWESKFICDDTDYDACISDTGLTYKQVFGSSDPHFKMIPNNVTGRIFRDVAGGWYDAADFDQRIYHLRVVRDLCEAYIRFPQNFTDNQLNIPESGDGIPDILSEAEWGIKFLKDAQNADGGIAAWIESEAHENDWPWRSSVKYCLGTHNRRDSLEYACTVAKFARALRMVGTEDAISKADIYTESAIRAFKFGVNHDNAASFQFAQESSGIIYQFTYNETNSIADKWVLKAAVSLFTLTKDNRYCEYITDRWYNLHYNNFVNDANQWANLISVELVLGDIEEYFPSFTKRERDWVLNSAEEWYNYQEQHTYHEMNWPPNHGFFMYTSWGIGHPEQRGRAFIYAWLVTGDTKFRDASYLIMDNSMGCNAIGRTATTGLGVVAPIHHLDSWLPRAEMEWNQHEPVPGISPYGIIGFNSAAVPYGYCMYQPARNDMGFPELLRNILPMGYSKTVGHNRGLVAQWMESRWPIWRNLFEAESYNVAQSEFTIWETICGKAFMCGCLMSPGYVPDETIKNKAPSTDQYGVEGLIYLP